jgi:hypothetical protein
MNPSEIQLATTDKMFSYERLARDIDKIQDIEVVRDCAKSWLKLYLKQEETIASMANML